MSANSKIWLLVFGLLAIAGTASAQPLVCKNVRTAPAWCAPYFQDGRRHDEMRTAPPGDMERSPRRPGESWAEYWDRRDAAGVDQAPDAVVDEIRDGTTRYIRRQMPRTGKTMQRYFDGTDWVTGPVGKIAETVLGKPIAGGLDVILEPRPNPRGYRDGQSRRHPDVTRYPMVEDAIRNGSCFPREMLDGPPKPLPGPAPTLRPNCASLAELQQYAAKYQREFEAIAAEERRTWEEPGNNLRDLDDMIRYAAQLMNDPSLSPELRAQLRQAISDMGSSRQQAGDRGIFPSPSAPFMRDRIHETRQEIDSKISIKPFR